MPFVHLHVHTQYSLLEASIRISKLLEKTKAFGMESVAVTDQGNLYAALEFYQKAMAAGIKPIIGLDAYVVLGDRRLKKVKQPLYKMVLIAKNNRGLENLFQLVTRSHFEGFYYKPRLDFELLAEHSEGLIALSGSTRGVPTKMLIEGQRDEAKKNIQRCQDIFGKENYYVEILRAGIPELRATNRELIEIARETQAPLVASNDCYYLEKEDAKSHDILMCVGMGRVVGDQTRPRFSSDEFYFKSPEEMAELFKDIPEAIENTEKIAAQCYIDIDLKEYHMPVFDLKAGQTSEDALVEMSRQGLQNRLPLIRQYYHTQGLSFEDIQAQYDARLESELEIIKGTGFAGYFLIVQDFINWAKNSGIPVGPGRGSAAGSLVAYALNITDVDPIPYNLLFERFLNKERISMPDIDVDFCQDGRDAVIRYVAQKYNQTQEHENVRADQTKVAQISTFGKLQARAVIRDVGRAMGVPYSEVDKIAKLVPNILNINLTEAFAQEPKFDEMRRDNAQVDELLTVASSLEGLTRHASVHAAGVVISDDKPLSHHLPLAKGQHDEVVTQWDMKCVENIGLVKFDFLGLKTLTLLAKAQELIKLSGHADINLLALDERDPKVFELLGRGETQGVFQLESSGMRDLVVRLKPSRFEDLIALVALYRPGPLGSGMVDDFIERKHGKKSIVYDLPELEPILKDTYGVILYQEQVMQIASKLASYSLGEADLLRRAMGKKIAAEMEKQEVRFLEGTRANGYDDKKAKKIFDLMAKFAGYGFNKSHSAAYALISFQTAYLKAHHPTEFMAACLSIDKLNTDRVVKHLGDCKAQNILVAHPNINEGFQDFVVQDQRILFGLAAVKNVGQNAIAMAIEERKQNGAFKDLFDFCCRVDSRQVNKKTIEALIKAGAFDGLGTPRSQMMASVEKAISAASHVQKDRQVGQESLFGALGGPELSGNFKYEGAAPWTTDEKLRFEKEVLGFYVSGHPLDQYEKILRQCASTPTHALMKKNNKDKVWVGGMVSAMREITTKRGKRMAFVTLEDLSGQVELVVFSEVYEAAIEMIKSGKPIVVSGELQLEEDQAKILAEKIVEIENASSLAVGELNLQIDLERSSEEDLEHLKEIMEAHKGDRSVRFSLLMKESSEVLMALSAKHSIHADAAFFEKIEKSLGGRVRARLV